MQLVEAGSISMDAPVQEYLPWFEVDDHLFRGAASTITVRHLLNHTSGIPRGKIIGASLTGNRGETAEEAVRALKKVTVTTPAGTTFQYLISSAQDMAQYLVAQLNEGRYLETSVLSPTGIAELHAPAVRRDPDGSRADAYGMGWIISSLGEPTVWHRGDIANFHSDMALLPAHHLGVVVLMNVNGTLAMSTNEDVIAQGVQQLLLAQQPAEESGFQ